MSPDENNPDDLHAQACNHILGELQQLVNEGKIPDGGMIAAYVTVVETMTEDGGSKLFLLWSDGRTSVMSGLLTCGQMLVTSNAQV